MKNEDRRKHRKYKIAKYAIEHFHAVSKYTILKEREFRLLFSFMFVLSFIATYTNICALK